MFSLVCHHIRKRNLCDFITSEYAFVSTEEAGSFQKSSMSLEREFALLFFFASLSSSTGFKGAIKRRDIYLGAVCIFLTRCH